jgi:hypothetical protein
MTNRNAGLTDAEKILLKTLFPDLSVTLCNSSGQTSNTGTGASHRSSLVFISLHLSCENIVQKSCKASAGMGFSSIWMRAKIKGSLKIHDWIVKW